jgi:hypothetical protein
MAASGYTPILIYASGTASNVPLAANLTSGASGAELALNYADGKLYYKDSGGVVRLLASNSASTPVTTFSAGTTGLTPSTATSGAVTLAGTLVTSNGGTGLSSFTAGDITYYASGTALSKLAIGTSGQILTSTGTAPQWSTLSGVAVTTFSGGTTGLTPSVATSGAITLAGTLNVANGGTGLTSLTANYIPYGNGTGAFSSSSGFTFNGTTLTAPAISLTASALTSSNTSNLQIGGTLGFSDTGIISNQVATLNSYLQSVIQNKSNGASASAEFIAYNDAGTASTNFATVGINSSGYTGTGSINAAGYAYFLSGSTDLVLGTIGANGIHFTVNSGATDAMFINSSGRVGVNNASPTTILDVAGTAALAAFRTPNILEISTVSATSATGTINYDVTTQSVLYYTSNAGGNFTLNFRGSSGTSLNTIMNVGDTVTVTFLNTNGSTAYYNSAVTIDGNSVTPKWQGGTAPTSGNASSVDAYTYAIVKTGSATFTVLASQTKFS